MKHDKKEAVGLYPEAVHQKTHSEDKLEKWFIDNPLRVSRKFLHRFEFLQNGNLQTYILYGITFVGLIVIIPYAIEKILILINFLNQV